MLSEMFHDAAMALWVKAVILADELDATQAEFPGYEKTIRCQHGRLTVAFYRLWMILALRMMRGMKNIENRFFQESDQ